MLLLTFIVLQALDALTTLTFLHLGVAEANPLIRLALAKFAGYPMGDAAALVIPKLFAVALAALAWRSGRKRVLLVMDILFSLCVAWNALAIFLKI